MPPLPWLPYELLERTLLTNTDLPWQWLTMRPVSPYLKEMIEGQVRSNILPYLTLRLSQLDNSSSPEWLHIEPSLQQGQIKNSWVLLHPSISGDLVHFDVLSSSGDACTCRLWSEYLCYDCSEDLHPSWTTPSPAAMSHLLATLSARTNWLLHAHTANEHGWNRAKIARVEVFHTRLPASLSSSTTIAVPWRALITFLFLRQQETDAILRAARRCYSVIHPPVVTHRIALDGTEWSDFATNEHWMHERRSPSLAAAAVHTILKRSPWAQQHQHRRTALRRAGARAAMHPEPAGLFNLVDPLGGRCRHFEEDFDSDPVVISAYCLGPRSWQAIATLAPSVVLLARAAWATYDTQPHTNSARYMVKALCDRARWVEREYGWFPRRDGLFKGAVNDTEANRRRTWYFEEWEAEGRALAKDEACAKALLEMVQKTTLS